MRSSYLIVGGFIGGLVLGTWLAAPAAAQSYSRIGRMAVVALPGFGLYPPTVWRIDTESGEMRTYVLCGENGSPGTLKALTSCAVPFSGGTASFGR